MVIAPAGQATSQKGEGQYQALISGEGLTCQNLHCFFPVGVHEIGYSSYFGTFFSKGHNLAPGDYGYTEASGTCHQLLQPHLELFTVAVDSDGTQRDILDFISAYQILDVFVVDKNLFDR